MKSLLSTIIIAIFISLTFATAFAEQSRGDTSSQQRDRHRLAYTFVTADISVPGHPDRIAFPEDINDEGVIVTNFFSDGGYALIADPVKRKSTNFKTTTFNCTGLAFADTVAFSINDKGQIAGYCVDAPSAPSKQFGFVRNPNGNHILLDFPGADGTGAFGINDRGQVVGQFYGPLRDDHGGALSYRFHCFIWDNGQYKQLDFPRDNTYVSCSSINRRGQVLGEYITVTLDNEYLEHGWFIYDNGRFILDFPLSFEHVGGPAIFLADMNNDGQIVGQRSNGGPDWNGLFLHDNGKFYDIELPPEFAYADVRGMNNKGQFVGMYSVQVGIDSFYGWPIFEYHGYVATPAPPKHSQDLAAESLK